VQCITNSNCKHSAWIDTLSWSRKMPPHSQAHWARNILKTAEGGVGEAYAVNTPVIMDINTVLICKHSACPHPMTCVYNSASVTLNRSCKTKQKIMESSRQYILGSLSRRLQSFLCIWICTEIKLLLFIPLISPRNNIVTWCPKAGIARSEQTFIARQRLGKQFPRQRIRKQQSSNFRYYSMVL
jgi:hypothetical protein